ncbi:MAG: hypothetical protein KGK07_07380 [Chloroflexota bacterium]|nr:hypothetical protein [Chloroflexota bacterium]
MDPLRVDVVYTLRSYRSWVYDRYVTGYLPTEAQALQEGERYAGRIRAIAGEHPSAAAIDRAVSRLHGAVA